MPFKYSNKRHAKIKIRTPLGRVVNWHQEDPSLFGLQIGPKTQSQSSPKLYSSSTLDRKYFTIDFGDDQTYNPSIIPHPAAQDIYIASAVWIQTSGDTSVNKQLVCNATFVDGVLKCFSVPYALAVETTEGHCEGDEGLFNFGKGPRDPRVFYGLDGPYIMYGSLATRSCLGLFLQNLGTLVPDFQDTLEGGQEFYDGTELQRPPPYASMQKNWFLFWDERGQIYVHHDMWPVRSFAQLSPDGSIGPNLALLSQEHDVTCMAAYMPQLPEEGEKIHQATNSLMITLCKRTDTKCSPTDDNTFIMTIVHHQTWYSWHAQYYPHVVLFKRTAPFELYSISRKSLWINGKTDITNTTQSLVLAKGAVPSPPQTELVYITSMSWKSPGQRYHGYIDDPLFLSFGIEDARSAAIDVVAGDLLKDLGLCADVVG
ncbi:hypothetical protein EDD36DRAFT_453677 [Exophiala viscosa]|uniref:Uncharacterized protein n=1 Tax=Exophiala viscosa TaxID=2486360 RepID=A0AAN6DNT3_9EURO|nr:hypothetical protein EDD36DRAFT_453677 [Exophiala viscosa]